MEHAYNEVLRSHFELFNNKNVDEIKILLKRAINILQEVRHNHFLYADNKSLPTRKSEMISLIVDILSSTEMIKAVYEKMHEIDKAALQEMVHSLEPLDWERFEAKYGHVPNLRLSSPSSSFSSSSAASSSSSSSKPMEQNLLCFFISPGGSISPDVRKRFLEFVPKPRGITGKFIDQLPSHVRISSYMGEQNEEEKVSLIILDTEKGALHDVIAVLQTVDSGKIGASAKTGLVSKTGAQAIRKALLHGDFYPEGIEAEDDYDVQMGEVGIKPFAWPLLLQAGNLAQVEGTKLSLTRKGQSALTEDPPKLLKGLWDKWLKTTLIHEMSRIEMVKGQKSKGHPMTAARNCRESIAKALFELSEDKWMKVEDFFQFLVALGFSFQVARNPWDLYLGDKNYGNFGYAADSWSLLNGRFTRAFLFEYAATLGIISVAYIAPWGTADDIGDLWGADELSCLSRYDGLQYLKLTSLGAWILGKKQTYQPPVPIKEAVFKVLPNLDIVILISFCQPTIIMMLESIAEQTVERTWKLSKNKILQYLEKGQKIEVIKEFLSSHADGDIPEVVIEFLKDIGERAAKVRFMGNCAVLECQDTPTAVLLANDVRLKEYCAFYKDQYLVIKRGEEESFGREARKLGFVIPQLSGK